MRRAILLTEATTSPSLCLGAIATIARQSRDDHEQNNFEIRRSIGAALLLGINTKCPSLTRFHLHAIRCMTRDRHFSAGQRRRSFCICDQNQILLSINSHTQDVWIRERLLRLRRRLYQNERGARLCDQGAFRRHNQPTWRLPGRLRLENSK